MQLLSLEGFLVVSKASQNKNEDVYVFFISDFLAKISKYSSFRYLLFELQKQIKVFTISIQSVHDPDGNQRRWSEEQRITIMVDN